MTWENGQIVRKNAAFERLSTLHCLDESHSPSWPGLLLQQHALRLEVGELVWRTTINTVGEPVRVGLSLLPGPPELVMLLLPAPFASPDIVTGLADRRVLEAEIDKRFHSGRAFALLFVDLDGFKQVNDLLGHQSGDRALREIAQRIRGALRDVDLVGRYGGDEFVILLDGAVREQELAPIVERVRHAAAEPLDSIPEVCELSASIGWALSTHRYGSPAEMLAAADSQMYANKREGC